MAERTNFHAGGDPVADPALFDIEAPPPVSLSDRFGVPPFSVLDRRSGVWQERRGRWLSLGIQSEVGRDARVYNPAGGADEVSQKIRQHSDGISIFDPVLCELVYRWFTPAGARVLDPFAGGSVRGIVASTLARWYYGIELRIEQVKANYDQIHLGSDIRPTWFEGDSREVLDDPTLDDFDLIFSCPPYANLEVYSDDPADLSNMTYPDFLWAYGDIIRKAAARLRRDRFAAWVVSDLRDGKGLYRGLVTDTVRLFALADLHLYNDAIILDPVASHAIRAGQSFDATRKLTRCHQHLLVFVKGDARRAANYAKGEVAADLVPPEHTAPVTDHPDGFGAQDALGVPEPETRRGGLL